MAMAQSGGDTYRPNNPRQASRSNNRADTYRPNDRVSLRVPPRAGGSANANSLSDYQPPSGSFDFRSDQQPSFGPRVEQPPFQRGEDNRPGFTRDPPTGPRFGYRSRPRRPPIRTHERPLLQARGDTTPERLAGMLDTAPRFKAINELSESEAEMDLESELELEASDNEGPLSKKVAIGNNKPGAADGDEIPKWSNPDPYTALPPPDESQGAKKDVVKFIRKAKITNQDTTTTKSAVAQNVDFIAFDFADDEVVLDEVSNDESTHLQPRGMKRKRGDMELGGALLPSWRATDPNKAKPWSLKDRSNTPNVNRWLLYEIRDFYDYVKPREFENAMRKDLVHRVDACVQKTYNARVDCFGSYAAGLYLPTADMDMVALSDTFLQGGIKGLPMKFERQLVAFARDLEQDNLIKAGSRELIAKARVPLVKFIDTLTGLRVDISFDNKSGTVALKTFNAWKNKYPAMPYIVYIIKQFLKMRGLNEVFSGGMSSFTVTCLVVSLLHHRDEINGKSTTQLDHLGDILLDFFGYYGNTFDYRGLSICLDPPQYIAKQITKETKLDRLSVINPNWPFNDICGGTKNIAVILRSFSNAHATLKKRMKELDGQTPKQRKGCSILESILGGNYSSFTNQRTRLQDLHRDYRALK
ncbi:MAG: hypothetical protein M1820_005540 [Bogoriella megaspora]|nr:MAG: hypothetical protein M1820_005540 [Bogoriella megaspora]